MTKALVICQSYHHGNTLKIALAMANVLQAEIKKPIEIEIDKLPDYDLIGLGSGINNGELHPSLFKLLGKIDNPRKQKVFIFSTSTLFVDAMHQKFRAALQKKGFETVGEFNCKGFMTYSFTKYLFGGLNRGRPNKKDLREAKQFAEKLNKKII